jgi:hypothetical protein
VVYVTKMVAILFQDDHSNSFNITLIILDNIHRPVFLFKIRHFGHWILSPSSGGTYSGVPNRQSQSLSQETDIFLHFPIL